MLSHLKLYEIKLDLTPYKNRTTVPLYFVPGVGISIARYSI